MALYPLISIIINCHNGSKYLGESIQSIIDQTYNNYEIIFWDNLSTDNSLDIARSFNNSKIKIFKSKKFTSLGSARNSAVMKAQGLWIAFLDCDDVWSPYMLQEKVELINSISVNDNVGIIYNATELIIPKNFLNNKTPAWNRLLKNFNNRNSPEKLIEGQVYKNLLKRNFIPLVSVLIKKDAFIRVNGIDSNLTQSEDYDLFLKISRTFNILCIRKVLSYYRIHETNQTSSNISLNFYEDGYILSKQQLPMMQKLKYIMLNISKSCLASIKNRNIEILKSTLKGVLNSYERKRAI